MSILKDLPFIGAGVAGLDAVERAVSVGFVVVALALVAGQALGQPVLLSYVETGSMEPTLAPGDGFVAVPAQVAGPVEEGDVVVFEAEELHGGGLTTHRVVDETDRGYVTKGDANPFTDQDGDEPPVREAQVVAVAWRPGGDVLVVPALGAVVTATQSAVETAQLGLARALGSRSMLGPQGLAYLLFGATVVYYAVSAWRDDGSGRSRTRSRERDDGTDVRLVVAGLALLVVVAATAAMVAPAGTQKLGIVSAESDAPGPRVIERGTTETVTYSVHNGGLVPAIVYLESGSDAVDPEPSKLAVPERTTRNATLAVSAPPDTGYYRYFVTEHRYLAVLPAGHVEALYRMHPWLPILAIDAVLGGGFYLFGAALTGRGRLRFRTRESPSAARARLPWPRGGRSDR